MNILKITATIFVSIVLSMDILLAEKIEITSDSMKAEDIKKEVHFIGNVKVKQLKNWIHGDKVIVYFDENNETKMYKAIGTVTFEFKDEKQFYQGSADKVTYFPSKSKYILTGKAIIDDIMNKRHVNGDEIILDTISGNANVQGSREKPVKFIFDVEDSK